MVDADEIIMHEEWDPKTFNNDIALVKLKSPAMLNNQVKLACLPDQGISAQPGKNTIPDDKYCSFL